MQISISESDILLILLLSTFSSIITYAITKKRHFKAGKSIGYNECKHDLVRNREIIQYADEYTKGKADGRKETLEDFTIKYDGYIKESDTFFKNVIESGYTMQLFYQGMPIGDQTVRSNQHKEKFKEENVNTIIDSVNRSLENLLEMQSKLGIQTKIEMLEKRDVKEIEAKVPKKKKKESPELKG